MERGTGQLIQIENRPLLTFEDDRAAETQNSLGDEAVGINIAAGAALASMRSLLRNGRNRGQHEQAGERRVSKRDDYQFFLDPRDSSLKT